MGFDRRTFLRQLGWVVWGTSLGTIATSLSPTPIAIAAEKAVESLARSGKRKLALLVGINQYPHQSPLGGCLTDVALQQELLVQRCGFAAADVLTLTDQQATREGIETAFLEHLVKQAQPDDQVMFHFSGYGSQIQLPTPEGEPPGVGEQYRVNALLPYDGNNVEGVGNYLLESTLQRLARSLPTTNVLFCLDTGYQPATAGFVGSWRSRVVAATPEQRLNQSELAFGEQLRLNRPRQGRSPEQLSWDKSAGWVILAGEMALEAQWKGLKAGLLTATLAPVFWTLTANRRTTLLLDHAERQIAAIAREMPLLTGGQAPPLFLSTATPVGFDGYINDTKDAPTLELVLSGMPVELWSELMARSQFQQCDAAGGVQGVIELRAKNGRKGRGGAINGGETLPTGRFVREWVRCLPRNLGLTIALDKTLQRIERVDATSALANVPTVTSVVLTGEQGADYLFTKQTVRNGGNNGSSANLVYGLFSAGGRAMPRTQGGAEEAVIVAINRIVPTFGALLAGKWWRLLNNEATSQLAAGLMLELVQAAETRCLDVRYSQRLPFPFPETDVSPQPLTTIPLGGKIRHTLTNPNPFPLYALLLIFDSRGIVNIFSGSYREVSPQTWGLIDPQSQLTIPAAIATDAQNGLMLRSTGLEQVYVLYSSRPWQQTHKYLTQESRTDTMNGMLTELTQPLRFTQAVLEDLHQASVAIDPSLGNITDSYACHQQAWACFSAVYAIR